MSIVLNFMGHDLAGRRSFDGNHVAMGLIQMLLTIAVFNQNFQTIFHGPEDVQFLVKPAFINSFI